MSFSASENITSGFRDGFVAASLKPDRRCIGLPPRADCFRDGFVAASLKPVTGVSGAGPFTVFPRRIRRGLIEAGESGEDGQCPKVFPRRIRRGLIEAILVPWRVLPFWTVSATDSSRPH